VVEGGAVHAAGYTPQSIDSMMLIPEDPLDCIIAALAYGWRPQP